MAICHRDAGGTEELPDMTSVFEERRGSWKSGHCVNLEHKSDLNADKGEGVKKSENFADIISGSSLMWLQ